METLTAPGNIVVKNHKKETGRAVSSSEMSPFAESIYKQKYALKDSDGNPIEEWADTAYRVTYHVLGALSYKPGDNEFEKIYSLILERKFMPGGRYLYAAGRPFHMINNCFLLKVEDSREGWADLLYKASMALMTGGGIGIDYSNIRPEGAEIKKTGGFCSGPISLMEMINECGRHIIQGGSRRSAIWAGLSWTHPDCMKFIHYKDWDKEIRRLKEKDFNFPAPLDMTNISVILDDEFFIAYEDKNHKKHQLARNIYHHAVRNMIKTAEPGFSIDIGENSGETARNACTELVSRDDSDVCCLGSINMAKFESLDEFKEAVNYSILFLIAGTVYSDVPYPKVKEIRDKNRRLGLGLMGIHEWLLRRGYKYEPNQELGEWLYWYSGSTEISHKWADKHGLSRPIKTRAIAPTGTIGIVAETTTGIEPIFCVAYRRRYLAGGKSWKYQYVIDPTAQRLIDEFNVDPNNIEDAYSLAYNVEKRINMQAFIQSFVDHGISSTINGPYPIEDEKEADAFAKMLYKYLPSLRGITYYPDGARGGQPLTTVPYEIAIKHRGVVFEEGEERCKGGVCGA